jgi:hypothetical protein
MAQQAKGGMEELEMITPWGPKTLTQTRTELAVNGRLGAAAGLGAAEEHEDAGVEFKATLASTAKFNAFNGGLKLLEVPRHQSTLQARTPPRVPLYSRPITAPPPSQVLHDCLLRPCSPCVGSPRSLVASSHTLSSRHACTEPFKVVCLKTLLNA